MTKNPKKYVIPYLWDKPVLLEGTREEQLNRLNRYTREALRDASSEDLNNLVSVNIVGYDHEDSVKLAEAFYLYTKLRNAIYFSELTERRKIDVELALRTKSTVAYILNTFTDVPETELLEAFLVDLLNNSIAKDWLVGK